MKSEKIPIITDFKDFFRLPSAESMLRYLGGSAWLFFEGVNHHKCRVITTLLHGNEPSGCHAVLRLIKEKFKPVVDSWILIASVDTALSEPLFCNRTIEGHQDLNRCFRPPWYTKTEKFAEQIYRDILAFNPEAIIDIHNTSGAGPGFCVATCSSEPIDKIAGLFSRSLVITDIKLGSLMESDFNCPVITVECGGNQSELSHQFAYNGITKFLSTDNLLSIEPLENIQYYRHPLRLELMEASSLSYGNQLEPGSDITLCASIEDQNFGTTFPEKILGWAGEKGLDCLRVNDQSRGNIVHDYFSCTDGILHTKLPLHLFMVTTDKAIAETDCLFYLTKTR